MILKKGIFSLCLLLLLIITGCNNPPNPAKKVYAASIVDKNNTLHIIYSTYDSDKKNKEKIYAASPEYTALDNGSIVIFDYEADYSIRDYFLIEPVTENATFLFKTTEAVTVELLPYLDQNGSWNGKTIVGIDYDSYAFGLYRVEDNGTLQKVESVSIDAQNLPEGLGSGHYVRVKGNTFILPYPGIIVEVIGNNIFAHEAAEYFQDYNLNKLQSIDSVDNEGVFHHLRLRQEYKYQELIYEKYVPSQTEPVYSEVIYKDKVKDETGNLTW